MCKYILELKDGNTGLLWNKEVDEEPVTVTFKDCLLNDKFSFLGDDDILEIEAQYRKHMFGSRSSLVKISELLKFNDSGIKECVVWFRDWISQDWNREVFKRMCRYIKYNVCADETYEGAWITSYAVKDDGVHVSNFVDDNALVIKDKNSVNAVKSQLKYLSEDEPLFEWCTQERYFYDVYLKTIIQVKQ